MHTRTVAVAGLYGWYDGSGYVTDLQLNYTVCVYCSLSSIHVTPVNLTSSSPRYEFLSTK